MRHSPRATVRIQRRGRYSEIDAIMIGTQVGDLAQSHERVFDALKKADIGATIYSAGSFRVNFDPMEMPADVAAAVVTSTLRRAGIHVEELGYGMRPRQIGAMRSARTLCTS